MRPPEVFVRGLSPQEGSRLKHLSTNGKYRSTRQRAMILLCSATGMSAPGDRLDGAERRVACA